MLSRKLHLMLVVKSQDLFNYGGVRDEGEGTSVCLSFRLLLKWRKKLL